MKLTDVIKSAGLIVPEREPYVSKGTELGDRYACWQSNMAEVEVIEDPDRWNVHISFDHPATRPDIWRDIVAMINARFGEETP